MYGTTILLASHYLHDIETVCARVVVIDEREFIFDGSLSQLHGHLTLKKVKATLPASADLAPFGLEWRKERGEWEGVVDPKALAVLLGTIGDG